MKSTPAEIERILVTLGETPARLAAWAAKCTPEELAIAPDKKSWSAQETLAHLRACADLWTHSIYAMLAEQEPVLPDINERKWARAARYAEVPFREALQPYSCQRADLMRVLLNLETETWERGAIVFERRHTIFTQARRLAKHEAEHCDQIKAMKSRLQV
jgi:hypothetical protein